MRIPATALRTLKLSESDTMSHVKKVQVRLGIYEILRVPIDPHTFSG